MASTCTFLLCVYMYIVNNAFLSLSEHFMYKSVFFQQPVFLERYHGIVLTLNHVITTFVSRIQPQYLRGAIRDEFLSYLCSDKIGYEINIELSFNRLPKDFFFSTTWKIMNYLEVILNSLQWNYCGEDRKSFQLICYISEVNLLLYVCIFYFVKVNVVVEVLW